MPDAIPSPGTAQGGVSEGAGEGGAGGPAVLRHHRGLQTGVTFRRFRRA